MPKIALRYTGSDEAMLKRLEATDGVHYAEPVDAKEILATPGNEFEPDEAGRKLIGVMFEPRMQGLSVPQLQGADAELQTGISHEKYGRSAVAKEIPNSIAPTMMQPMTTTGRPLDLEQARSGEGAGTQESGFQQSAATPRSEGMTKEEMQTHLRERGVHFDSGAKKDDLAKLVDANA
jgi:hypothetical protein